MDSMMKDFSAQGMSRLSAHAGLLPFATSILRASLPKKLTNWLPKRFAISCRAAECVLDCLWEALHCRGRFAQISRRSTSDQPSMAGRHVK